MPVETFGTGSMTPTTSVEPKIKQEIQEITPIPNVVPGSGSQHIPLRQKLNLVKPNDSIEYMSSDLDDSNIQGMSLIITTPDGIFFSFFCIIFSLDFSG